MTAKERLIINLRDFSMMERSSIPYRRLIFYALIAGFAAFTYSAYDSLVHLAAAGRILDGQPLYVDGKFARNFVYPPLWYGIIAAFFLPVKSLVPQLPYPSYPAVLAMKLPLVAGFAAAVEIVSRQISSKERRWFLVFALASPLVLATLLFTTHADALVASALLIGLFGLDEKKFRWVGFGFAAATALKLWPVIPGLVVFVRNKEHAKELIIGGLVPGVITIFLLLRHPVLSVSAFFGPHAFGLNSPLRWSLLSNYADNVGMLWLEQVPWTALWMLIAGLIGTLLPVDDSRLPPFVASIGLVYGSEMSARRWLPFLLMAGYIGYTRSDQIGRTLRRYAWIVSGYGGFFTFVYMLQRASSDYPLIQSRTLPKSWIQFVFPGFPIPWDSLVSHIYFLIHYGLLLCLFSVLLYSICTDGNRLEA